MRLAPLARFGGLWAVTVDGPFEVRTLTTFSFEVWRTGGMRGDFAYVRTCASSHRGNVIAPIEIAWSARFEKALAPRRPGGAPFFHCALLRE